MNIKQIISGGQIGVDQAGLRAAKLCGIETGGMAPYGYKTEDGPKRKLLKGEYGLLESESINYKPRTKYNIRTSDATLVIAVNPESPGTALTMAECRKMRKPYFLVDLRKKEAPWTRITKIRQWLEKHKVEVLNVAGNRDKNAGLQAYRICLSVFRSNGKKLPDIGYDDGGTDMEEELQKTSQQQRKKTNKKRKLQKVVNKNMPKVGFAIWK